MLTPPARDRVLGLNLFLVCGSLLISNHIHTDNGQFFATWWLLAIAAISGSKAATDIGLRIRESRNRN